MSHRNMEHTQKKNKCNIFVSPFAIESLPDEILVHIFDILCGDGSNFTLVNMILPRVCRRFHDILLYDKKHRILRMYPSWHKRMAGISLGLWPSQHMTKFYVLPDVRQVNRIVGSSADDPKCRAICDSWHDKVYGFNSLGMWNKNDMSPEFLIRPDLVLMDYTYQGRLDLIIDHMEFYYQYINYNNNNETRVASFDCPLFLSQALPSRYCMALHGAIQSVVYAWFINGQMNQIHILEWIIENYLETNYWDIQIGMNAMFWYSDIVDLTVDEKMDQYNKMMKPHDEMVHRMTKGDCYPIAGKARHIGTSYLAEKFIIASIAHDDYNLFWKVTTTCCHNNYARGKVDWDVMVMIAFICGSLQFLKCVEDNMERYIDINLESSLSKLDEPHCKRIYLRCMLTGLISMCAHSDQDVDGLLAFFTEYLLPSMLYIRVEELSSLLPIEELLIDSIFLVKGTQLELILSSTETYKAVNHRYPLCSTLRKVLDYMNKQWQSLDGHNFVDPVSLKAFVKWELSEAFTRRLRSANREDIIDLLVLFV